MEQDTRWQDVAVVRIKNLRAVTMKGRMTGELRGVSEVQSMGVGAALLCGVTEEKD